MEIGSKSKSKRGEREGEREREREREVVGVQESKKYGTM